MLRRLVHHTLALIQAQRNSQLIPQILTPPIHKLDSRHLEVAAAFAQMVDRQLVVSVAVHEVGEVWGAEVRWEGLYRGLLGGGGRCAWDWSVGG